MGTWMWGLASVVPADAAEPEEAPVASAWILADKEAREAGVMLEVDGVDIDATLPVEVERDAELAVIVGDQVRTGWIDAGLVYVVEGKRGKVRAVRPGVSVAADAIRVLASDETRAALADESLGQLTGDILQVDEVVDALARVPIPEGDVELQFLAPDFRIVTGSAAFTTVSRASAPKTERVAVKRPKKAERRVILARRAVSSGPKVDLQAYAPPVELPANATQPPEKVAWYCDPAGCLVLGINGRAQKCDDTACRDVGGWWMIGDLLVAGGVYYGFRQDGVVVEVSP